MEQWAQPSWKGRGIFKSLFISLGRVPVLGLLGISETGRRVKVTCSVAEGGGWHARSLLPGSAEKAVGKFWFFLRLCSLNCLRGSRLGGEAGAGQGRGGPRQVSISCSHRSTEPRGGRGMAWICRAADSSRCCSPGVPRGSSSQSLAGGSWTSPWR